ncbi:hypothetical protein BCY90_17375 [Agrobacterium deltaense]|uniref:hypothetical protein n=1 Tax=Agrobacterium TaxID=357 RepID=UPI000FEF6BF3|nr:MULTISPECIES: hypothetical protein [Agrobacterium]RKF41577.1 hypothetical protein BCY90_17375 [Agrobacterium deltaense]
MMTDPKTWPLVAGFLAAALWLASAVFSFAALRVNLDVTAPPGYDRDHIGILLGTDGNGRPAFSINGMTPPTKNEWLQYQRTAFRHGAIAAAINGTAAVFACIAAFLAFVI